MRQVARTLAAGGLLAGAIAALALLGRETVGTNTAGMAAVGEAAPTGRATGGEAEGEADAGGAGLAGCRAEGAGDDMSSGEAAALYDCIAVALHERYLSGTAEWRHADLVREQSGWQPVGAFPVRSEAHGGRFVVIRVGGPGARSYRQFAEDPDIPPGTRIAMESFGVGPDGTVEAGPLWLMEKVDYESSPETMGWYYMAVGPDGVPMGIDPWAECNDCHVGRHPHTGGLGYPPAAAHGR